MELSAHLQSLLDSLPTKPGCYLMKNAEGGIIYVGKAVNLRNRVRSYFHSNLPDQKTRQLVRRIADIEWIVVGSELEALILEMNLIKRHRPQYNIRMKDDKRYPYIKVHWGDAFPKVTVTRQIAEDGGAGENSARYYGPYTAAWAVYQTLDVLRRVFPFLTCDREITGKDSRACLYYDIKRCLGPCIGAANRDQYRLMIDDLCKFLEGRSDPVLDHIQQKMTQAAENLEFERAAALRDQLRALQQIIARQKVVFSPDYIDSDVVAVARSNGDACVQVFFIRGGKLIGREYFVMEGADETPDSAVLAEFLKQFYDETPSVPGQLLLPTEVEEMQVIREWLNTRRGGQEKVEIRVPREGQQSDLVQMAAENAAETLAALKARWANDTHRQEQSLQDLQEALALPAPPNRIECYDISNTQGVLAVGSMVVFEQGAPKKAHYRRFNIRTVQGPNDFESMEEMLRRRFGRWKLQQNSETMTSKRPDPSFQRLPDLLIVDGGKGQLSRAVKVLGEYGLTEAVPVVGLAKQNEELFLPQRVESILLPRTSQGLYLVQRVRDEAHRFAITAHRARRDKQGVASKLDAIPGIGPKRRRALLAHFGDIEAIRTATLEALTAVDGITTRIAEQIKAALD
jgi:excinuclease ABC subunit C